MRNTDRPQPLEILKRHEYRPGAFWEPGQIAEVDMDTQKELIDKGIARIKVPGVKLRPIEPNSVKESRQKREELAAKKPAPKKKKKKVSSKSKSK